MKKRLFCALIMMILCVCALAVSVYAAEIAAEGQCTETVFWTLDSEGLLAISGSGDMPHYSGTFEEENLPPWYDIKDKIQSIVIETGVTSIGDYAFCESAASSVTMANTVKELGKYAFTQSTNLTSVTLSENLTAINDYVFQNCSALSDITIPDNVMRIGTNAFGICSSLSAITIPANVTEIGSCAFISCSKLASVYFEGDVPSVIMEGAFLLTSESLVLYYYEGAAGWVEGEWKDSYDNTYKTVKFAARPANGKCSDSIFWTLDSNGLLTVSGLGEIPNYEDFIEKWNKDVIRSVVIDNTVTHIGNEVFSDCCNLSAVTFPLSLKTIGSRAFQNCDSLTTLIFPEGLEFIDECAFEWCDGIIDITFPDSLKQLGEKTFSECLELTSVAIGAELKEIGANPFCLCPKLSSLTVDSNNQKFAAENDILFSKDMKTLYIDTKVMRFGMTDYQIPDGVIRIADRAFSNCSTLETVTFPASLKVVGDRAFQNCENLTTIKFNSDMETIEGWAFEYCCNLTEILLPAGLKTIGNRAFQCCDNLTDVIFPAALNEIGDNVFDECPNLVSAAFEGEVPSEWSDNVFGTENVSDALVISYYANYSNWTTPTWTAPDGTVYATVALDNNNPPAASDTYSVSISASKEEVFVNEIIEITVTAGKAFAAAELLLSYDKDMLTFVGVEPAAAVKVSADTGTVKLVDFGIEKTEYEFTFIANDTGVAEFTLISAAFGAAEDAATKDLVAATISTGCVSVVIGMSDVSVTLPTDILNGNSAVAYGEDYTFSITDDGVYYEYTVNATMGGESVTVIDHWDGTYTVENVTAALVITATRIEITVETAVMGTITSSDSDITSVTDDTITITLTNADNTYSAAVISSGVNGTVSYCMDSVAAGTYTMTVNKQGHVEQAFTVIVDGADVTVDVILYLLGDGNHDGKADSSDAVAILRHLAGYEVENFDDKTADFNGDGKADSSDAVAILRKLAGY